LSGVFYSDAVRRRLDRKLNAPHVRKGAINKFVMASFFPLKHTFIPPPKPDNEIIRQPASAAPIKNATRRRRFRAVAFAY
jgi:hypothetical protein